jgi:hypothetical protein
MQRLARWFLAGVTALVIGSCGAGGGTETTLPPGQPTTAPPGNLVIYAALADQDEIVAYRLGTDGLLPADPFDSISVDNPRDLLLKDGVLYAALKDRVIALQLGADGSLPPVVTSQTTPTTDDAEAVDLLILNNVLYVAFQRLGRVCAFPLEFNGQLPPDPISSSGTSTSEYTALAVANGYLYATSIGESQIDTFIILSNGALPDVPASQDPSTVVYRPQDLLVSNGILYVIGQSRERIESFNILENGLLPSDWDSRTNSVQRYARLLLDGDRLYGSGFSKGRLDMFLLEADGSLPKTPAAFSSADAATFPINMVLNDGILYVTQSGPGRVDAYILGADGSPPLYPSSSTNNIDGSEPLGLALGTFLP